MQPVNAARDHAMTQAMTEKRWLTSQNPEELLKGLPRPGSDRKLLLLTCAVYRQNWCSAWAESGGPRAAS
jgi:hypothetical protein